MYSSLATRAVFNLSKIVGDKIFEIKCLSVSLISMNALQYFTSSTIYSSIGKYPNGIIRRWDGKKFSWYTEYFNNDGIKSGYYRKWFHCQLIEEHKYINGKICGISRHWWNTGCLHIRCHYVNGLRHGLCENWNADKLFHTTCNYINGKKHGNYKIFYRYKLLENSKYENGKIIKYENKID